MKQEMLSKRSVTGRLWMVVYTRSNYEKKAHQLLQMQGLQSFCPIIKVKSKWADRIKTIEVPLFKSYLFVYVNPYEHLQVLQTTGVISYVNYCGKPAIVPQADIERVRDIMNQHDDIESVSARYLKPGDTVVINEGALNNKQGEIVKIEGKSVLIVIKQLDCALIAKIKVNYGNIHKSVSGPATAYLV
ncbi:UpxY family transcription antiterminator [Pedobacter mucosus]|uniref:UpxY family transcription antiterminator n=1 Tax=Pedobacter mucosus TaxID=2895286 RepID=UPI001EE42293|nr:UpxY family transcription antiterminator [Pedobacter mucosus]UKT62248.1 UpxY family transcription antiterminator [Pedobacter mucosus]